MIKIGITGTIGSGKSYASRIIQEMGGYVYSMDESAKYLEENDPWLIENIKIHFGDDIYNDGILNKKKLADIIFTDDNKLKIINEMIKGPCLCDLYNTSFQLEHISNFKVMFIESALMSSFKQMDHVLIITSSIEDRMKRVVDNRGISESDFIRRNNLQSSLEDMCDYLCKHSIPFDIIVNDGTENFNKLVCKFYEKYDKVIS